MGKTIAREVGPIVRWNWLERGAWDAIHAKEASVVLLGPKTTVACLNGIGIVRPYIHARLRISSYASSGQDITT